MIKGCTLTSSLTARLIAKVDVLVRTDSVLVKTNNVLVCVVSAYILNELLKIKHRIFIVFPGSRAIETNNILVTFNVPITRFLPQTVCPLLDIVLVRVTRFYEPDQFLGPCNEIFLLFTQQ